MWVLKYLVTVRDTHMVTTIDNGDSHDIDRQTFINYVIEEILILAIQDSTGHIIEDVFNV